MICIYILSVQKSIDFNSYLYYAHILFYCRSHMKVLKSDTKECASDMFKSVFFLLSNIKRTYRRLWQDFFFVILALLSFEQHQSNTYVSYVSNEFQISCTYISDNILLSYWNLYMHKKGREKRMLIYLIIIIAKRRTVDVCAHFSLFFFFFLLCAL